MLRQIAGGNVELPEWKENQSVLSHFKTGKQGARYLSGAGLRSVPLMVKSYDVLSKGEKHRCDFARLLEQLHEKERDLVLFDEFTSELDRVNAKSMAASCCDAIKRCASGRIVFCTVNIDILPYVTFT